MARRRGWHCTRRALYFRGVVVSAGQRPEGSPTGEWRAYSADEGSTRYSPLDQINRDNVKNLQVAWTWKFDNFGTPAADGHDRDDAADGQRRALFHRRPAPHRRRRRTPAPARRCGPGGRTRASASIRRRARCIAAWPTGPTAGDERIVVVTPGFQLVSLNAKTGAAGRRLRRGRHRRPVQAARQRRAARSDRQDRQQLAAGDLERRDRRRAGADCSAAASTSRTSRPTSWRSTSAPARSCGRSTRSRARARPATRRG